MSKLFKKCCSICDLQESDLSNLPDWQIEGFSVHVDWELLPVQSVNPCCIRRVYRAVGNEGKSVFYTDDVAKNYVRETAEVTQAAISSHPLWLTHCGLFGWPRQAQCDDDLGVGLRIHYENILEQTRRIALLYWLWEIEVRIGQHASDCEPFAGDRPFTVTVEFRYRTITELQYRTYTKNTATFEKIHPCMPDLADINDESLSDYPDYDAAALAGLWLSPPSGSETISNAIWCQQYLELPEQLEVNPYESPIGPEYFEDCIRYTSACHVNRVPKTPDCSVASNLLLDEVVPLMELREQEACVTRTFGSVSVVCCEEWMGLFRQVGSDPDLPFGVGPHRSGPAWNGPLLCVDACVSGAAATGDERAVRAGRPNYVSYEIDAEYFNDAPVTVCVPPVEILLDASS